MIKGGCCEVIIEEVVVVLWKVIKWVQLGFIVSIGLFVEFINLEIVSGLFIGDKKKIV